MCMVKTEEYVRSFIASKISVKHVIGCCINAMQNYEMESVPLGFDKVLLFF